MMDTLPTSARLLEEQENEKENSEGKKKLYIESYGCQMNFSDSEIVASVLAEEGYAPTSKYEEANLIFLNTCSIREKAEQTVRNRLKYFQHQKDKRKDVLVGVLGCMAERLKKKFLEEEKIVDIVAGPDAYRDLPKLVAEADDGRKAINVFLSREETYADINPVRINSNGVTAFISIMRGCNNMCSFCVVPFTRGRERSRDPYSIVREAEALFQNGYREVTLLGQNVDSFFWRSEDQSEQVDFADLLLMVAKVNPLLRVRFSTSHPKDITEKVLLNMKAYENICKYIHLPVQSGSSRILELMNRGYTREWYLDKIKQIRTILGEGCGISSDVIAGFCTETEEDHQATLSLMEQIRYDFSYMFYYSERPGTPAAKKLEDDIPLETKKRRLQEIIAKQGEHCVEHHQQEIGKEYIVLVEGRSKKSEDDLQGRNSANKLIVFPKSNIRSNFKKGDYVRVKVLSCTAATLIGEAVEGV